MPDWLISLIAAFLGAFGGTSLNRYISIVDNNNLKDKETLVKLKPFFIDSGLYEYLKEHHFGEPFDSKIFRKMDKFTNYCDGNPDFIFINRNLENKRAELQNSVKKFAYTLAKNSYDNGRGISRIQNPEFDDNVDPKKFEKLWAELNKLSSDVTQCYDSLVIIGHKLH